jgi:WxL domain surface cell wall-binding
MDEEDRMKAKITHIARTTGLAAALVLLSAVPAGATSATATLTAGSLAFVSSPPSVSFSTTLNGTDQTVNATQAIDVDDATGSGTGWNLTATSTSFTTGSHTLSTSATNVASAPSVACDASVTCTTATSNVSYPYALPAAATAPTATKLFNATANTGMGQQTVTPTWGLGVLGNTFAGNYTSTWTLSLVSGP